MLTKDQILAADDLKSEAVEVPEWGGSVIVRALNGLERDEFEASTVVSKGKNKFEVNLKNLRAKLVARSVIDDQGNCLFSDQDVEALSLKSGKALDRVFSVAQRLSGLTKEDMEELVKNSESGPDGDSPSV